MKKHEPTDHDPSLHAAVIACAIIAAAIVIFASLTDDNTKSLEAWVYRYQTLITGFFAIGAAYLTVSQMRKTDAESERRHRDLVRLGLRSDRLRLHRAFSELPALHARIAALEVPTIDLAGLDDEAAAARLLPFVPVYDQIYKEIRAMNSLLSTESAVACTDLFDGPTVAVHKEVHELTNRMMFGLAQVANAGALLKTGKQDNAFKKTEVRQKTRQIAYRSVMSGRLAETFAEFKDASAVLAGSIENLIAEYTSDSPH